MPYPAQITRERILAQARTMIEAEGGAAWPLHQLAAALGVKAPSLYKYFPDKMALLRAVNEQTAEGLVAAINTALDDAPPDPFERMRAVALAYRAFAHANPVTYGMLFTNTIPELRPDDTVQEQRALPLQAIMAELSGEADSLAALRGAQALIHGFVTLELSSQFRRGGDLDAAFVQSVEAYLRGWGRG